MDNLLYDCYSVFWQIAVLIFGQPEQHFETLLTCYILSGLMFLLVIWALLRIVSAFAKMVLSWFGRAGG